jgi:hypothetical protein
MSGYVTYHLIRRMEIHPAKTGAIPPTQTEAEEAMRKEAGPWRS